MKNLVLLSCAVFLSCVALAGGETHLKLATTTSTENTGLLKVLLPPFEKRYKIKVDVIAVGTGKAMKLAENGDVDVILVHAPDREKQFMEAGYGVNRRAVMHNDFVILGPPSDPAGIKGLKDACEAFRRIARGGHPFVSRGDESGTHIKEKSLWKEVGIEPRGKWYMEAGQGMGATLIMANEKLSYVLCDRATYLAFCDKIELKILCEGDERLQNYYSVIAVNPARFPHVKYMEAMMFIAWITSPEGQKIIRDFRKNGEILFHPDAVP